MTPGDRFKKWIDETVSGWKVRIGGWVIDSLGEAAVSFMESAEPQTKDLMRDTLTRMMSAPNISPELKEALSASLEKSDWVATAFGYLGMIIGSVIGIMAIGGPPGRVQEYAVERFTYSARLDPQSVITAWRRDKATYEKYFDDLRDQGWTDERIKALQFITEVIPNAADIVRFALREVYSPEIAEKYGQFEDIPEAAYPDAEKAGLSKDMFNKYWAAHWSLPSASDGFELLHRGILTEDELKGLLKANDIMPYWRDQLIKLSWNIPTRIDVRRFWDMRTIDETRLREIYQGLGYHGRDLDDYVLWTKIYTDFPDLLARYKNGWITLDQVKSELVAMGMSAARADTMIEEKIKKAAPERVAAEKDLSKTDIINGVKKDVITRVQGAELLQDIGYSSDEALYLLDVNIPVDETVSATTARELTKSDVLAGLKAGVITEEDAINKLLELRYTQADAEFLLKVFQSAAKPPAEANLKEASKADIVTAVKKGLITQEAGYLMLLDIGFESEAAMFILSVATETSPFSPQTFDEFKDQTQKYRLAAGMEGKPMPEEIKRLGAEVVRLSEDVSALERSIKREQGTLIETEGLPPTATARLKELQAALYKAQAELARVQVDYRAKVAEWKHAI